jgi:hypothetical protein
VGRDSPSVEEVHAEWLGFLSTQKFRFFWAMHSLILNFFGFGFGFVLFFLALVTIGLKVCALRSTRNFGFVCFAWPYLEFFFGFGSVFFPSLGSNWLLRFVLFGPCFSFLATLLSRIGSDPSLVLTSEVHGFQGERKKENLLLCGSFCVLLLR